MPTTPEFEYAYQALNPPQRKAVDTIEGPVMVIAGPGTGKTQILTLRIANILLKTDTQPENILALTFTEAGAYAMRKRLVKMMGTRAYKITITTFHSFCNELIAQYPERFPRIVGGLPVTDADQVEIIATLLDTGKHELLRPYGDPSYYVTKVLRAIQTLKREGVSQEEFQKICNKEAEILLARPDLYHEKGAHKGKMKGEYKKIEESIAKNKELALLYAGYQAELAQRKRYDYDDMIVEAVKALERDENFRLILQEQYQYILADEHQDTNNAQNRILELLSSFHASPNLFIVGDEKQAIYRFQGANLANFLYFHGKFPVAILISLEENYRSKQQILDAAHSLILHAGGDKTLRKELKATHGGGEKIHVAEFPDQMTEQLFVVDRIKELIESGVDPNEIAVFYRNNNDAPPLIQLFEKVPLPFTVLSETHLLTDDDIASLVLLLQAINAPGSDEALAPVLYLPYLGIHPIDAFRIIAHANDHRLSLARLLDDPKTLALAGVSEIEKVTTIAHKLHQWASFARAKSLLETLDTVLSEDESHFIGYLLFQPGSLDRIEKLEQFINLGKSLVQSHRRFQLADFLAYLDTLEAHELRVQSASRALPRGVRLMTAHKSKGLEFDHVFIVGANDGHWGGKRSVTHFKTTLVDSPLSEGERGNDDDERRLFYVALTRARLTATITYPRMNSEGKELHPTRFIDEIDSSVREMIETAAFALRARTHPVHINGRHTAKTNFGPEVVERDYLRKRFLDQGLSVSALNNYLECPWHYFFKNLIRIPQSQDKFALYGTAIHSTLEAFFRKWREEAKDPGEKFLLERFHFFLERMPLAESEFTELLEKGTASLPGYYREYHKTWTSNVQCEFPVRGIHLDVPYGDDIIPLLLKGNLDKVEFLDEVPHVNVVDYKTAKPKSRNVIEGNTKSSDGNYKRQLVFYKLLLDSYDNGKFVMQSGEIDFTEPDDKGKYHREKFIITDEEVEALKAEVRRVTVEIYDLAFWNSKCEKEKCQYCLLRTLFAEKTPE